MDYRRLTVLTLALFTVAVAAEVLLFSMGRLDGSTAMTYLGLGSIVASMPLVLHLRSARVQA